MKGSLTLFVLIFLLGACVGSGPKPSTVQPTIPTSVSPLPTAMSPNQQSPLPTPRPSDTATVAIPTPSNPNAATVTGYLLEGENAAQPVSGVIVALAEVVLNAAGTPTAAGYDRQAAPKAETDQDGRFVFRDVKPGHYAFILDRITEAYMLNDPKSGGDMLFNLEPGQILNVGRLVYPKLPGAAP